MKYDWEIAERLLFNQRFGSMSVQEFKKVLFAVYMTAQDRSSHSRYEIGRALGLTEAQVKNLYVGSNLLLGNERDTIRCARESLRESCEATLLEYQRDKNRISVQIADPVAFNYIAAKLESNKVFRDCDSGNGHIAVPVDRFGYMLRELDPEFDFSSLEEAFSELVPEYWAECKKQQGTMFEKLSKWLPLVSDSVSILGALGPCVATLIHTCC